VLLLMPSLSLVGQTLREWMANKTVDFTPLMVCSAETVNNDDDIPVSHASDLGCR
jgi:predicted helicase